MKNIRHAVFFLLLPIARAAAQNVPAASALAPYTGFALPDVSGTMTYSLSASQRFALGYYGSGQNDISPSIGGTVAYLSESAAAPFSAVYSGAFIAGDSNGPNRLVSSLSLSQVFRLDRFNFIVADSVGYLPGNPVAGLSGVAGIGDGNVPPLTGSNTGVDIQTLNTVNLTNRVSGTVSYPFSAATSLSGTAGYEITRYLNVPGGSTNDTNSTNYSTSLRHSLDPYTTIGLSYSHDKSGFSATLANGITVTSQSISGFASRKLTPSVSVNGSIGPQFSSSSNSALSPSVTSYSFSGGASYINSFANASFSVSRGINAGSGLIVGAENTSVSGRLDRQIGDFAHASTYVSYSTYTSLLAGSDTTKGLTFGGQANRSIGTHFSAFLSYTLQHQISQGGNISPLLLQGNIQTFSIGVTYSPSAIHVGRQ